MDAEEAVGGGGDDNADDADDVSMSISPLLYCFLSHSSSMIFGRGGLRMIENWVLQLEQWRYCYGTKWELSTELSG